MVRLIKRIATKAKEVYERVISIARAIVNSLNSWIMRIKRHKTYVGEIEESTNTYDPEIVDIKLAEELKKSLDDLYPGGIVTHMQKMTSEERVLFIERNILPLIAAKMSITYDHFEWFEDDRLCGFYNHSKKMIALNMSYVSNDSEKLLTILLNTIIHECKHARQWAAVEGADLGYSQQQINEWKRNFDDYISPIESDEGYFKQPVELDARGFANSIIDENVIFES